MLLCRQWHCHRTAATSSTAVLLRHGCFPLHLPMALRLPSRGPLSFHRPLCFTFHRREDEEDGPLLSVAGAVASSEVTAAAVDDDDEEEEEQQQQKPREEGRSRASRKQNARSAAVLGLLRRDCGGAGEAEGAVVDEVQEGEEEEEYDNEERRRERMVEEISLVSRRKPRFPGAIDFPKAGGAVPAPVLPAGGSDTGVLLQALEVRRGVAAEILKEALKASKFSITYSTNLVSRLSGFVDRVLIEAAAMKGNPEFSHLSFNARVKSYIQSSGVIPLVKWLKHNSLSYPQIGKAICMCTGKLERVRQLVEWLKSVHVKGEFLGVVLMKAEMLLERSTDELDEIVDYLQKKGVRGDWVGFVVSRCPQILALSMEDLERRVNFYLEMGMDHNDFGTMVYDYPRVLGFFRLEEMNDKVSYLRDFGLSTNDIRRLLAYKPQLMGCSIEERWKPLVKYLYYLGVQRDGMKRILLVKPMVFCVDLETTIAPKVRFLHDIGIHQEAIGGVLVKFPPILTYNLYKKIRPVVIFLMTKAGVSRKDIGKVIALEPELIGCSIMDKLDANVKYFLSLGITLKSLGEMIADFPMLLKYNLEVLRPKYRYLRRTMVRPLQDLIEFPRFFSYSLDGRIIPRHKILIENRINFKLRYMLPGSDEDFNQRVKAAVEKRQRLEFSKMDIDVDPDGEATHAPPGPGVDSEFGGGGFNKCLS